MKLSQATLRRLSHDLRGSLANLRIGLQACQATPDLFGDLAEALLEEVERVDRRMLQLSWLGRCTYPHPRPIDLGDLVAGWSGQVTESWVTRGDPDLLQAAFLEVRQNAETYGGGLSEVRLLPQAQGGWSLRVGHRGGNWPEHLQGWLEQQDMPLWNGQLALGLRLVQQVLEVHQGRLILEPNGLCWEVQ